MTDTLPQKNKNQTVPREALRTICRWKGEMYDGLMAYTLAPSCGVIGCHNDSWTMPDITFHKLPKNIERRVMFMNAVAIDGDHICSQHFKSTDFRKNYNGSFCLRRTAVPSTSIPPVWKGVITSEEKICQSAEKKSLRIRRVKENYAKKLIGDGILDIAIGGKLGKKCNKSSRMVEVAPEVPYRQYWSDSSSREDFASNPGLGLKESMKNMIVKSIYLDQDENESNLLICHDRNSVDTEGQNHPKSNSENVESRRVKLHLNPDSVEIKTPVIEILTEESTPFFLQPAKSVSDSSSKEEYQEVARELTNNIVTDCLPLVTSGQPIRHEIDVTLSFPRKKIKMPKFWRLQPAVRARAIARLLALRQKLKKVRKEIKIEEERKRLRKLKKFLRMKNKEERNQQAKKDTTKMKIEPMCFEVNEALAQHIESSTAQKMMTVCSPVEPSVKGKEQTPDNKEAEDMIRQNFIERLRAKPVMKFATYPYKSFARGPKPMTIVQSKNRTDGPGRRVGQDTDR